MKQSVTKRYVTKECNRNRETSGSKEASRFWIARKRYPMATSSAYYEEDIRVSLHAKTVFTTGEAAKICKVSQQTIIRCFDNGSLNGFRVPGSRFRRIPRDELYAFMRENKIPTDALESGNRKVLIVDDDEALVDLLVDAFSRDGRFDVKSANNGFGAGMLVKEFRPDLVVLDVMLPDINGKEVCTRIRSDDSLEAVKIICISGMVEQDKISELTQAGANDFMHKPFTVDRLLDRACDLMEMERAMDSPN